MTSSIDGVTDDIADLKARFAIPSKEEMLARIRGREDFLEEVNVPGYSPTNQHWYPQGRHYKSTLAEFGFELSEAHQLAHSEPQLALYMVRRHPRLVKMRDCFHYTMLHMAAGNNHMELAEYLVEAWPSGLQALNHCGQTPLHRACIFKNLEMAIYLARRWPKALLIRDCGRDKPLDYVKDDDQFIAELRHRRLRIV